MKDLKSILELATGFLQKHNIAKPRLVSETSLAHFLKLKRIELYMHFDRPLSEEDLAPFRKALKRIIANEPLEYVLGEIEFFGVKIKVAKGVLIPRQETEILLEHVSKKLDGSEKKALDLCSGSGCLAVALKNAHPGLDVTGVDLSEEALEIARENSQSVNWVKSDLLEALSGQKFDLVICNPPYVTEKEYEQLESSVKDYEPKMALVSGERGTEFYERLERDLPTVLEAGAKVFFEIGTGQAEALKKIFSGDKWTNLHAEPDWAGHDRFFWLSLKEISHIMV